MKSKQSSLKQLLKGLALAGATGLASVHAAAVSYYQLPAGDTGTTYITAIAYTSESSSRVSPVPTGLPYWPNSAGRIIVQVEHTPIVDGTGCLHNGTSNVFVMGIVGSSVDNFLLEMLANAQSKHTPVSLVIDNYCVIQTVMPLPRRFNGGDNTKH